MIGSLAGKISYRNGDSIILEVNGVGYEITLSGTALDSSAIIGGEASYIVYTDVRENAISLYGFASSLEKQVFMLAKKVKGIGSRLSLAIISSLGAEGLLIAVGQENIAAIQRVPGIGKKTAERIIVELREQVANLVCELNGLTEAETTSANIKKVDSKTRMNLVSLQEDAILALEKLGLSTDKARHAVNAALNSGGSVSDSGELVKRALANL